MPAAGKAVEHNLCIIHQRDQLPDKRRRFREAEAVQADFGNFLFGVVVGKGVVGKGQRREQAFPVGDLHRVAAAGFFNGRVGVGLGVNPPAAAALFDYDETVGQTEIKFLLAPAPYPVLFLVFAPLPPFICRGIPAGIEGFAVHGQREIHFRVIPQGVVIERLVELVARRAVRHVRPAADRPPGIPRGP